MFRKRNSNGFRLGLDLVGNMDPTDGNSTLPLGAFASAVVIEKPMAARAMVEEVARAGCAGRASIRIVSPPWSGFFS